MTLKERPAAMAEQKVRSINNPTVAEHGARITMPRSNVVTYGIESPKGSYLVVASEQLEKLVDRVNELMGSGWAPLGGVSHNEGNEEFGAWTYCQAMVLRPEYQALRTSRRD